MQKIYLLDLADVQKHVDKILPLLAQCDREKAEGVAFLEDRLRFIGGRLLIKAFTAQGELRYNENGKPFKDKKPFFNISHSGNKVGVFISDNAEVGFDIQEIKPFADKILDYAFSEEKSLIKTDEDFAKIWTMKESAVKFFGKSVAIFKSNALKEINDNSFVFCGQKLYYKSGIIDVYAFTVCSTEKVYAEILEVDCDFIIKTLAKSL